MYPDESRSLFGFVVITIDGLYLLISLEISFLTSKLGSKYPSGYPRNSIAFRPSIFPASLCSFSLISESFLLDIDLSSVPFEPSVQRTYITSHPSLVHFATEPEPVSYTHLTLPTKA